MINLYNLPVSANLVIHVHQLEDGSSVVGDGDVVVGRDHHLVQALRTQRRSQGVGDRPSRQDVALEARIVIQY